MTTLLRKVLSRLGLVLLGVCLSLLFLEAALRIGALFVGRGVLEQSQLVGKWRILALGDSNTYGLYVDKSQAYPKVFEALWNANPDNMSRQVEVFNMGFPGMNSSKLVKDFRRMLWTFRPDVVTVMVGANDLWTMPETAKESPNRVDYLAAALWRASRVYRFLYMMRRAVQIRQLDVTRAPSIGIEAHGTARYGEEEFDFSATKKPERDVPGWQPAEELTRNLETLSAQATEFGAKLVFLTYAADSNFYSFANSVMRDTAKATGTPLIDVAAVFKPACPVPAGSNFLTGPGAQCPELFPDQHPTVIGHEKVAQTLARQLASALDQSR
jgi:lysophospholipase L1-like esterase